MPESVGMSSNMKTVVTSVTVLLILVVVLALFPPDVTWGGDPSDPDTQGFTYGIWSLVPPIIAIALALVTKRVYPSLMVGVVAGALVYSKLDIAAFLEKLVVGFDESLTINNGVFYTVLTDTWNVSLIIFFICLGSLVHLMRRAGASRAFGDWARMKIKGRSGASLSTIFLGLVIFVDDYFNCLTVGSVMRPVTDTHGVSRAKLAYIIDCTAAPVCIIAPISSWAAAVSGFAPDGMGIGLFIQSIPYNFYALLTILMVILIAVTCMDFGPMRRYEINAIKGDVFSHARMHVDEEVVEENPRGSVMDLFIPIVILFVCCIFMMLCTGGLLNGVPFVDALANCNSAAALAIGGAISILLIMLYYYSKGLINGKDCFQSIPDGFSSMWPAIFILVFAWSLNSITGDLGANVFIHDLMAGSASELLSLLPAVIFVASMFLAFSTGTSWGSFGIMIPIVVSIFPVTDPLYIISMAACLAGAVWGDHSSPISDTTIMASVGAECELMTHVQTQLPYTLYVASISLVSFLLAGFLKDPIVPLLVGVVLTVVGLFVIKHLFHKGLTPEQEIESAQTVVDE